MAFTKSDTDVTTWMGSDNVGSTAVTRDENGVVNTQRFTPFGELRNDGNLETDHLFTGQVLDESSGLAFYNARYYDPAIGRFITPDSIVPNPLDGQDYNRYSYVRNNPIKYNDPSGNEPCRINNSCSDGGFDGDIPAIIENNNRVRHAQGPGGNTLGGATSSTSSSGGGGGPVAVLQGGTGTFAVIQNVGDSLAEAGSQQIRPGVKGYNTGQSVWVQSTYSPTASSRPGWMTVTPGAGAADAARQVRPLKLVGRGALIGGVAVTTVESFQLSEGGTSTQRALETGGRTAAVTSGSLLAGMGTGAAGGAIAGPPGVLLGGIGGALGGGALWDWAVENIVNAPRRAPESRSLDCSLSFMSC